MKGLRGGWAWVGIAAVWLAAAGSARAQQHPAVGRAVEYLRASGRGGNAGGYGMGGTGETALAALALIKAEVPATDPALAAMIQSIDARFTGSGYRPERSGGPDVYEAAVTIMALANLDATGRKPQIAAAAEHIKGRQNPNGSWDYDGRTAGDTSISQYAVLGLWEADNAGVRVSPGYWDRAAAWYLSVQSAQGSWTYHRDAGGQETISMTAAGVGSLLICRRQLAAYKQIVTAQNPYMVPVLSDAQLARYKIETSSARIDQGIRSGIDWIGRSFALNDTQISGQSPYYALYGIERVGALSGLAALGRVNWYERGSQFLASTQVAGGSWSAAFGDVPNTAWGVLFLTKSTSKTIERIRVRRLGGGELFGGKGLPRDLSMISEAGGRLVARPMDGAIEGMLTVLEDPRALNAESALAGLLARYQESGSKALQPYKDRFRKLLNDDDPGIRRVAAWALSRTGDLTMAPALIAAIRDPDEAVVREAGLGLQLLGRKIEGFGPPSPITAEGREAAIRAWTAWYESVRPLREGGGP